MSIKEEIIEIVVQQLGVDANDVTPETSFIEDLNADSLDITELVMTIEAKFNTEIPEDQVEQLKTVGSVIKYVQEKQAV